MDQSNLVFILGVVALVLGMFLIFCLSILSIVLNKFPDFKHKNVMKFNQEGVSVNTETIIKEPKK